MGGLDEVTLMEDFIVHVAEIKEYLDLLDLTREIDVRPSLAERTS